MYYSAVIIVITSSDHASDAVHWHRLALSFTLKLHWQLRSAKKDWSSSTNEDHARSGQGGPGANRESPRESGGRGREEATAELQQRQQRRHRGGEQQEQQRQQHRHHRQGRRPLVVSIFRFQALQRARSQGERGGDQGHLDTCVT